MEEALQNPYGRLPTLLNKTGDIEFFSLFKHDLVEPT